MAEFQYTLHIDFTPENSSRGERVTATAAFDPQDGAQVIRAMVRIPEYGVLDTLKPVGDNRYVWQYIIPWEAPVGKYNIEFFGFDQAGARGPVVAAEYRVTG